jgi:hypothetical protein
MRADLVLMALAQESNRYSLTRLIAKATRKLHRPNTRLQDTMNDAFERVAAQHQEQPAALQKRSAVQKAVLHDAPRSRSDFSPPLRS